MAFWRDSSAFLLLYASSASQFAHSFSTVRCTKPLCGKDERAVRKLTAPKLWAYGCNDTDAQRMVNHCCVEKEICLRTCGMEWNKCSRSFETCVMDSCTFDDNCTAAAIEADVFITGGDNHMAVCKAYRESQKELCDCLPRQEAKDTANARLTAFYAAVKPDRLDENGNVKDVEKVWNKWQGREPELFLELTRKYRDEAVDLRPREGAELARWKAQEEKARQREEAEAASRQRAEEELHRQLQRRQAEAANDDGIVDEWVAGEIARRQQEEAEARRRAEEAELLRRMAEQEAARQAAEAELSRRKNEVSRLRAEKDTAIGNEDFQRAKAIKAKILELDPRGEL
eukprot:TRINITY_DN53029_c0_g1_i2.p1 TRINITY_DN53029_c0_g1~~TRINITY_DN53029_c0_g1_i2.p1  ORF type:complete len:359 (+),score=81.48 TRINITY_DN53029_c0_g1_i2:49-1077(+)